VCLEYLQRRRLHNLPRQPIPGLRRPQREEDVPVLGLARTGLIFTGLQEGT